MLRSGYIIIFGGEDFRPDEFLIGTCLRALVTRRGELLRDGTSATQSWLEFADVHDGTYPLDAATEAVDLLRTHHNEFIRLSRSPGVVERSLNFFGDVGSCAIELAPQDITLLCELSMSVSICPLPRGLDSDA